jgi:amidase
MAGVDAHDPVTVPVDVFASRPSAPKRVALLKGQPGKFNDEFKPCTQQAVQRAGEILAAAGYEVEEVAPPPVDEVLAGVDAIVSSELVTNLRPLLGKFVDPYMAATLNLMANSTVDLERYMAALRERDHLIRKWQLFMETYPLVVMPGSTSPDVPVLTIDNADSLIRSTYRCLSHLRLSPLLGFPAISVPVSVTPELFGGRPLGVEIMAPRYRDDLCLEAAEVIELHEGKRQPIDPRWQ